MGCPFFVVRILFLHPLNGIALFHHKTLLIANFLYYKVMKDIKGARVFNEYFSIYNGRNSRPNPYY